MVLSLNDWDLANKGIDGLEQSLFACMIVFNLYHFKHNIELLFKTWKILMCLYLEVS